MKTIKDTPGREKETSPTHKVVFNQIQNRINDEHKEVVEEMQKEEEMLTTAFNNSYNYLTNKVTMDYVLHASESEFGFVLAHNTHVGPTKMELENMILHFIETEEYEKCAVLKGILNKEYPESINESLEEWL